MHYTAHSKLTCKALKKELCEAHKFDEIHQFIDSSKKYYWHASHRALLHTIDYGQELLLNRFGHIYNDVPTNEILVHHLKDDFSDKLPTLKEWLNKIYNYELLH